MDDDCFIPYSKRRVSSSISEGADKISSALYDGYDRVHRLNEGKAVISFGLHEPIEYVFDKPEIIESVHITFDSDLNRETLNVDRCEKEHMTRANVMLDSPVMHMPTTLAKAFTLNVTLDNGKVLTFEHQNNRKRYFHASISDKVKKISLIVTETWGDDNVRLLSFDYR
jgi:hypothetical protein